MKLRSGYAKPNIMQANTSFVILDPKGELLRDTGHLLEEKGYVIKVLDLINPERSHCYNPFEKSILMPMQWDGLDDYREEYNQMLLDKATNGNGIVQEKFLTVSVRKKDVDAARSFFARVEADLSAHFSALGSTCGPMNAICIWKRRISSRRMGGCRIRMKTAKRLPRRYLIISLACVSPPRKSTPSISGNALILSSV